jgi:hypothetical protein
MSFTTGIAKGYGLLSLTNKSTGSVWQSSAGTPPSARLGAIFHEKSLLVKK